MRVAQRIQCPALYFSRLKPLCALALLVLFGSGLTGCGKSMGWTVPPIRISGSIGDNYRTAVVGDRKRQSSNEVTADLRAATYIWQPWFVKTEGGVVFSRIANSGPNGGGDGEVIGGDAKVDILPISRFPTTLSYSKTDSTLRGSVGNDYTTERASIVQSTFLKNGLRVRTILSRDETDGFEKGQEEINNAGVVATKSSGKNQLTLDLWHRNSDFQAKAPTDQDEEEETNRVNLSHSYVPSQNFRLNNTVNVIQDREDRGMRVRDHLTMQGITTQSWRSSVSPLSVTSALRVQREEEEVEGTTLGQENTQTNLISGAVGMNYRTSPRLTTNLGLSASYWDTKRVSTDPILPAVRSRERYRDAVVDGGINYLSIPKPAGKFIWRWDARANTRIQHRKIETGTPEDEASLDVLGNARLGHTLARPIHIPFLGLGRFSLGQSAGGAMTTEDDAGNAFSPRIAHDAALAYSASGGGKSTFMRISLKDQREFLVEDAAESQFLIMQLNRGTAVDTRRNWLAAMTASASRRKVRGEEAQFTASAMGNIAYRDRRVFDIVGLRFSSILELNLAGLEDLIRNSDANNRFEQERRADWTNKIEYRIGLITTSLEGSIFYTGEVYGNSVFFSIRRDFNGVF